MMMEGREGGGREGGREGGSRVHTHDEVHELAGLQRVRRRRRVDSPRLRRTEELLLAGSNAV
jgi:hypothetical protein